MNLKLFQGSSILWLIMVVVASCLAFRANASLLMVYGVLSPMLLSNISYLIYLSCDGTFDLQRRWETCRSLCRRRDNVVGDSYLGGRNEERDNLAPDSDNDSVVVSVSNNVVHVFEI